MVLREDGTTGAANVCWVLREDPELAEAIEPNRRAQAVDALIAREARIPAGEWRTRPIPIDGGIGLLVLEGVLLHRVGIDNRFGAELIGEGDVLRSLRYEAEASTLPLTAQWLVLESARVAVLDERFVRQLARFPQVAGRLFGRSVLRSRQLAVNMAIVHQARVDLRLHLLFWHLAGRWGRVRSDGVLVPLRLTHAVLADLVAARRPTVTSALSDLSRRGLIRAVGEGWLLAGPPPGRPPEDAGDGTAQTAGS
ncbi:MAG TPA: Crp/Fnr family transcriptional regulator [Solirubrobacteraceae bacterium]|jgi:CRP-like cAMP-binding protein|nr:Crp/Fnr family transcriptional regulator [Solirubrobacteraceae bacterium]